jgi:hypothetical protein
VASAAGTVTTSAYEPVNDNPVTRSPRVPSPPITAPATSPPMVAGSAAGSPSRTRRTAGSVTPIAPTRTGSSPGPGTGSGASSSRNTPGPPYS